MQTMSVALLENISFIAIIETSLIGETFEYITCIV